MKKEALALCVLIAISVLYFDIIFYHSYLISEKYGSEIQRAILGNINNNRVNAQVND
jgi:hypothetical protein